MPSNPKERLNRGALSADVEREHLARYQFACEHVGGKKAIDIACGAGYGSLMLADAGALEITGLDLSQEALRVTAELPQRQNLRFEEADAHRLIQVPDRSVDVVVSFETIEHLRRPELFVAEVRRVLRPTGCALISTPERRLSSSLHWLLRRPHNPFHVREFTQMEFASLLRESFEQVQMMGQVFIPAWRANAAVQLLVRGYGRLFNRWGGSRIVRALYDHPDYRVLPPPPGDFTPRFCVAVCRVPRVATA
jgi:ubiquinone/menaquinone biosynthesis C-methylase UbiE